MSSELERRLEGMLAEAPEPDPGAGEEALHRALQALRPVAGPHRGVRTAVLVFAAAVALLAVAAGALATAGALHVSFGQTKPKQRAATSQLSLPSGADGIAAIVGGRLSVVTNGGFRLQGLPVAAAALSPHALYVAAGIGRSLVAMTPNGHQAWSHNAGGRVVAIAWAPYGNRIAYIVHAGRRLVLHVIWGNGINDKVIDRSVRPVRPSWRADSLAFAYVGAGGRAIVYDLAHADRLGGASAAAPVVKLAFAPQGQELALATPGRVVLVAAGKVLTIGHGTVEAIGWLNGRLAVTVEQGVTPPVVRIFSHRGSLLRSFRSRGRVIAVSGRFLVTLTGTELRSSHQVVLRVRPGETVADVQIG